MKLRLLLLFTTSELVLSGCSHVFYQPSSQQFYSPSQFKIRYEDISFEASDHTDLHGWFFPARIDSETPYRGVLIQFHGNAENISSHFASLAWTTFAGYDFMTFDYRGYGKSLGHPNQEGLNQDALAAISYAQSRVKPDTPSPYLVLYGQSLGGAVLMRALADLTDKNFIRAVIIDSSFYSYQKIAQLKLAQSYLTYLLQPLSYLLISDEYSPEKAIDKIAPVPFLVIHGTHDRIIPIEMGEGIFARAKQPKWFWRVKQGRHIDSMAREEGKYRNDLIEFLEEIDATSPQGSSKK